MKIFENDEDDPYRHLKNDGLIDYSKTERKDFKDDYRYFDHQQMKNQVK